MYNEIQIAHFIYFLIMFIGAGFILYLSRKPGSIPKIEYVVAGLIPVWSGLSYLSIALGQGLFQNADGLSFFARYIDWVITTPLLLLSLCLTAMYNQKKQTPLIITIVSADVIMILSGLIADLSSGTLVYVWFTIGSFAFLVVFYIIWFPLREIAKTQTPKLYAFYNWIALYLCVLWSIYPTAWILGPNGISFFSERLTMYIFIVVPILSKLGFSIIDLLGLRKLTRATV